MPENDPQQAQPDVLSGTGVPVSQQDAAAVASLDSLKLPPNPLTARPQGNTERDYEASFKGLMKTYQEEKRTWEAKEAETTTAMQALATRLEALEKAPSPTKEPQVTPPKSEAQKVPVEQTDSDLLNYMAEADTERFKLKKILEYVQPGAPGHGLPLGTFIDAIESVPPVLKDDGTVDDSGQKQAIEKVISALRGVQGATQQATQQAMIAGYTPGVSPGAPQQQTAQDLEAEYYRLKELYGSPDLEKMPENEQRRIQSRYYELHEKVGKGLPYQTQPFMDVDQIGANVNQLLNRIGLLEQGMTIR